MKKTIVFIIITLILLSLMTIFVSAISSPTVNTFLRAGGGGGGGGGFVGRIFRNRFRNNTPNGSPLALVFDIILYVFYVVIAVSSVVVFYFNFLKSYIQLRRFIKETAKSDNAWKYENILSDVKDAYYSVQNAWTNMDMSTAKDHMEESLLVDFQLKLDEMERLHERNVLEKIKLIKAVPVYVYDNENNENDFVWFYIKGSMIDYKINTDTQKKVSGTKHKVRFVEYWRFVRREDKWVLSKIAQEYQADQIPF